MNHDQARLALESAERLYEPARIEAAVDRMAERIDADLAGRDPILVCVMNGGLVPAGMLLTRLGFPLRVDYLHASRYRGRTFGTGLDWKKHHELALRDQTLLIVDDILDEGHTLEAVVDYCRREGAAAVRSAVLVKKLHDRGTGFEADYVGLDVPDRYVFGYGMDYKGYWRNAPGIYAARDD